MPKTNGSHARSSKTKNGDSVHTVYSYGNGVAWLALTFSIISLLFNIFFLNRDELPAVSDGTQEENEILEELRLDLSRLRASSELAAIEARRQTARNYTEFESDITEVRDELRASFERAGRQTSAEWQEINNNFETALTQMRSGTRDSFTTIQSIIDNLRQELTNE